MPRSRYRVKAGAEGIGLTSYDMRTPAENAALFAFIDAATSDTDPGYPHGAAFIPWQETLKTNLKTGRRLTASRGFESLPLRL
jgi:hypothetical protein